MKQEIAKERYEAPQVSVLGTVGDFTADGCDKTLGSSDGYTFMGSAIICSSA